MFQLHEVERLHETHTKHENKSPQDKPKVVKMKVKKN